MAQNGRLGDGGLRALARGLGGVVESLNLSYTGVSDTGLALLAGMKVRVGVLGEGGRVVGTGVTLVCCASIFVCMCILWAVTHTTMYQVQHHTAVLCMPHLVLKLAMCCHDPSLQALRVVSLTGTRVTPAGVTWLRRHAPSLLVKHTP